MALHFINVLLWEQSQELMQTAYVLVILLGAGMRRNHTNTT